MTKEEAAFIRGFAAAVAQMARRPTNIEDLLRSIGASEALLEEAGVELFDTRELRPYLETL